MYSVLHNFKKLNIMIVMFVLVNIFLILGSWKQCDLSCGLVATGVVLILLV